MTIYKRIQYNDIYCLDAEGHIREMSFADKVEDLLYQVGSAFSVLGLVCMEYMVIT